MNCFSSMYSQFASCASSLSEYGEFWGFVFPIMMYLSAGMYFLTAVSHSCFLPPVIFIRLKRWCHPVVLRVTAAKFPHSPIMCPWLWRFMSWVNLTGPPVISSVSSTSNM